MHYFNEACFVKVTLRKIAQNTMGPDHRFILLSDYLCYAVTFLQIAGAHTMVHLPDAEKICRLYPLQLQIPHISFVSIIIWNCKTLQCIQPSNCKNLEVGNGHLK